MSQVFRVAIADIESSAIRHLRHAVEYARHTVVAEALSGEALVERCRATKPSLIVTAIELAAFDGLEACRRVQRIKKTPVIFLTSASGPLDLARLCEGGAFACLAKPVQPLCLEAAIAVAMRRFQELQDSHQEVERAQQALLDRKLIERAKAIVMKRMGFDEPTAFRHLQKLARRTRRSLSEISDGILTLSEVI